MHIAYHLGAHFTDDGQIAQHLWHHRATLAQHRCHVLPTDALNGALQAASGGATFPAPVAPLPQEMTRAVVSRPDLLGPALLDGQARLYPQAIERLAALLALYPGQDYALHLALRHPATLLAAMGAKADAAALALRLSWYDLIAAIRKSQPDLSIILWRDEDSPYMWEAILGQLTAGVLQPLPEENRALARIMQPAGFARLTGYLAANTSLNDEQRRQVTAAFLNKFAHPDQVEQDIAIFGWSQAQLDDMDRAYLEDVARLRSLPQLRVLGL